MIYNLIIPYNYSTIVTILNELIEFGTEVLSLEEKQISTVHEMLELSLWDTLNLPKLRLLDNLHLLNLLSHTSRYVLIDSFLPIFEFYHCVDFEPELSWSTKYLKTISSCNEMGWWFYLNWRVSSLERRSQVSRSKSIIASKWFRVSFL